MSKIVVAVLLAVLMGGAALYAIGAQMVPATGAAGTHTKNQINSAFQ